MEEKGLVKCITSDEPNFRYYEISKKGREVIKKS